MTFFFRTLWISAFASVLMGLHGIGPGFAADSEKRDFDAQGLERLVVENESGDVKVRGETAPAHASVVVSKIEFESHCKMALDRSGKALIVKVEKSGIFKSACRVNFDIIVPKKIVLDLATGSGDLEVRQTEGDVSLGIGSGNATLTGEINRLNAKLGSGDIKVDGLRGDVSLKTGNGDANLIYPVAPKAGRIDAKVGNGDLNLTFPKNARILTHTTRGTGETYNELGDSRGAPFEIDFIAGRGNLNIRKK